MRVSRLQIENFRGISKAELHFSGHTLLIGGNNVGKSTICEALDLVLGPDRLYRTPPVEEFDFRNAGYLDEAGEIPVPIRIEAVLTDLTDNIKTLCAANLEFWHRTDKRLLGEGEIGNADDPNVELCLRLITVAQYDIDDDQFYAKTIYGRSDDDDDTEPRAIPTKVKRSIGFLYLRTIRTGSRALSLVERSIRCRCHHRLKLLDDAGFDKDASLIGGKRYVEHAGEHVAFQVHQTPSAIRRFRLQAIGVCRLAATLWIAFDQGDKALIEQPPMFVAQTPACRCVAFQARAQALVEQNVTGIEGGATDQADVTFQRHM
jgi:hypothetical protein